MKINRYLQRGFAWFIWSFVSGMALYVMFRLAIVERDPYGWIAIIFPVYIALFSALLLYAYPKVSLGQQGVCVKWLFRTRFYAWGDFCQIGISSFYWHWDYTNCMVLVNNGCSKRKYRDFLFHIRNLGKLIYIPVKTEIVSYVRSCYGPLDFDLSDGKIEQSIVIDE